MENSKIYILTNKINVNELTTVHEHPYHTAEKVEKLHKFSKIESLFLIALYTQLHFHTCI